MTLSDSAAAAENEPLWTFEHIAQTEPRRAAYLQQAPLHDDIAAAVADSFRKSCLRQLRVGLEQSACNRDDRRVVMQFPVSAILYDQFLNSCTGYRAAFRRGWSVGVDYNYEMIRKIWKTVFLGCPENFRGRLLNNAFEDVGEIVIVKQEILRSLDLDLSKIWYCGRLMEESGKVRTLASGLTGPRLQLSDGSTWAAPLGNENDCWLDVKGAFFGKAGLYQLKDSVVRAKRLHASGEA